MKLFHLCVFGILFSKVHASVIPSKKICRDCKHFIGDSKECRKFDHVDIITGKVTYTSARIARESGDECGDTAVHFERNNFKIATVPYYFIKGNFTSLLFISFLLPLYLLLH